MLICDGVTLHGVLLRISVSITLLLEMVFSFYLWSLKIIRMV